MIASRNTTMGNYHQIINALAARLPGGRWGGELEASLLDGPAVATACSPNALSGRTFPESFTSLFTPCKTAR